MHNGVTTNEFGSDKWTASCSCGWQGEERDTDRQATDDLVQHYAGVQPLGN